MIFDRFVPFQYYLHGKQLKVYSENFKVHFPYTIRTKYWFNTVFWLAVFLVQGQTHVQKFYDGN